jgi:hypothetical protein
MIFGCFELSNFHLEKVQAKIGPVPFVLVALDPRNYLSVPILLDPVFSAFPKTSTAIGSHIRWAGYHIICLAPVREPRRSKARLLYYHYF